MSDNLIQYLASIPPLVSSLEMFHNTEDPNQAKHLLIIQTEQYCQLLRVLSGESEMLDLIVCVCVCVCVCVDSCLVT